MRSKNDATNPFTRKLGFARKSALLATVGASAVIIASAAYAQEGPTPIESVTVSSSRIQTAGFNAPTPTTVLGSDFIEGQAKDTIFTAVTQLPSMMGSTGVESGVNGTSGGTNGLASFNMFGLGTIRTLTLLDSERFMPANVTGVPDISEFPQMLIQRVDVVTGGASASWGSDAVGGVVNFITDKKYTGFKANISSGLSTYGDNATATIQAAAGTSFAGGRGHFEISGEFSHMDGVQGGWQQLSCCGNNYYNSLSGGRSWFTEPTILEYGATSGANGPPAGQPMYVVAAGGQQNQLGRYGMINTGPLQGLAFAPGGTTYQFNYGVGPNGLQGVAAKNAAGNVTNCVVQFCIGGETDGNTGSGVTLATPLTRGVIYGRLSYDLTPNTEVFLTYNWSQVGTSNIPNPDAWLSSLPGFGANAVGQDLQPSGIQCGNAKNSYVAGSAAGSGANVFLPASVNAACIANNITTFQFGSLYYGLGPQDVYTQRDNRRLVGGVNGTFNVFDTDWTWNGYYEHGENDTSIKVRGITLKPYLYAAVNAIAGPNGTVVCADPNAQAEGCVPFNPFGGTISEAQKDWLYGGTKWGPGPRQISHQMQDVADFAVSGTPFNDWAGKVSIATGATWRQEAYNVNGDGAGNGTIGGSGGAPGSPCVDPVLNCVNGTNWYAGSFHNGQGNYHVLEAFVETNIPLIDSTTWGSANLNLSGRHARYSTAGDANTWKVGATWDTPVDGLRLRALQSRDIRAPNLSELFAAPTTANGNANDPWTNQQLQVINGTYGNPALKPERSLNTQLGFVIQPSWFPGFQTSLDYYRINVEGYISTVPVQTSINNCFAGLTSYCSAIIVAGGANPATTTNWTQVNTQFFNIASLDTDGFNLESSYQFSLDNWDVLPIPGNFSLRVLATYIDKFIQYSGLAAVATINQAGSNSSGIGTPHMKVFGVQTYTTDNYEVTLSENWISQGRQNLNWVQCAPGSCPVAVDTQHPTVNDNHVPGIYYINLGGSYNLSEHWKIYTQIDNLLNKSPPADPANSQNPTNDGANPLLYDVVGRMYHVGVRISD
jgi:iron complex outermembrane receptor protein